MATNLLTATLGPVGDDLSVDVATAVVTIDGRTAPLRAFADAARGDDWLAFANMDAVESLGYRIDPNDEEISLTAGVTTFTVSALLDPAESYAFDMIVQGAEHIVEDDLNEEGELSDADHDKAVALASRVIEGMKANPGAVLALATEQETSR